MDSGTFEMRSDIGTIAEEAQMEASLALDVNLRWMVNNPAFSDVVFVCNDEERVQGSRTVLAGRSDVLKGMLMNGMAEFSHSEIKLPKFSSPVLLSVFEFLYAGTLLEYHPRSWKIACEVTIASRFFLLPKLERIIRKFMHKITLSVVEDLKQAASLLTEAVGIEGLRDPADVSLKELVTILSSNWEDNSFVRSLSEDAFHYLLANSKGECEDDSSLSFREYHRFRQVIRWWIYQSDFDSLAKEEHLNLIVPDEQKAVSMCSRKDDFETVQTPLVSLGRFSNEWRSLQLDKESRNSVSRLLSNINYRWIHPVLLTTVVEPLKIASSAEVLSAIRHHACRRLMIFVTEECNWNHGEYYKTLEQGFVVHKNGPKIGLAVALTEMRRSHGLYQWSFIIEEFSDEFLELGFLYHARGVLTELDGERLSDQRRARVLKIEEGKAAVNWVGAAGGRVDWKVLRLRSSLYRDMITVFTFDPYEHSCSLSIGDKYFGVVWRNLPCETYYPAVSLGSSSQGRVRVDFVSGFDLL